MRMESGDSIVLITADGTAFGVEIEKVYSAHKLPPQKVILYLTESFEWLILKSVILGDRTPDNILAALSWFIDSCKYFAWEQFFRIY